MIRRVYNMYVTRYVSCEVHLKSLRSGPRRTSSSVIILVAHAIDPPTLTNLALPLTVEAHFSGTP